MTKIRNHYKIVWAITDWNLEIIWDLEFVIWDLSRPALRTLQTLKEWLKEMIGG